MPMYDLRCATCRHEWEAFHAMRNPHPDCPRCGGSSWSVPTAVKLDRVFHGESEELSVVEGWNPKEVEEARAELGKHNPDAANCIKDNGDVYFRDRAQQRTYAKALQNMTNRFADQKAARNK